MQTYTDRIHSLRKSGHGHYEVVIEYYGQLHTATINDMTLIDAYKSEDATIADAKSLFMAAKRKAIV
tara:strand:- start:517 stop:717 length:201 start_codon:yes stop_codon:yes gene_type:complete